MKIYICNINAGSGMSSTMESQHHTNQSCISSHTGCVCVCVYVCVCVCAFGGTQ